MVTVSSLLPGLSSAILEMREGDHWIVTMSPAEAYGPGRGALIPGGSVVAASIRVLQVFPGRDGPRWHGPYRAEIAESDGAEGSPRRLKSHGVTIHDVAQVRQAVEEAYRDRLNRAVGAAGAEEKRPLPLTYDEVWVRGLTAIQQTKHGKHANPAGKYTYIENRILAMPMISVHRAVDAVDDFVRDIHAFCFDSPQDVYPRVEESRRTLMRFLCNDRRDLCSASVSDGSGDAHENGVAAVSTGKAPEFTIRRRILGEIDVGCVECSPLRVREGYKAWELVMIYCYWNKLVWTSGELRALEVSVQDVLDAANARDQTGRRSLSLEQIFEEQGTDKGSNHRYHRLYEPLFTPFRTRDDVRFFEIGVAGGDSVCAWLRFFQGTNFQYHGVDPNLDAGLPMFMRSALVAVPGIHLWAGHVEDPSIATKASATADSYFKERGGISDDIAPQKESSGSWDIVVDDGNHELSTQVAALKILWPEVHTHARRYTHERTHVHTSKSPNMYIKYSYA